MGRLNLCLDGMASRGIDMQKIREMNKGMINTFEQARQISPQDPGLNVILRDLILDYRYLDVLSSVIFHCQRIQAIGVLL